MDELKRQLKSDARRHSSKLINKLAAVVELPELAIDAIHTEILYATMDGYRATMKLTRNGESENEQEETFGNR